MTVSAPKAIGGELADKAVRLTLFLLQGPLYEPSDADLETFFRSLADARISFAPAKLNDGSLSGMHAQKVLNIAAEVFKAIAPENEWTTFIDALSADNITIILR